MFVFTASYISSPERLEYLRLCVESVRDVLPEAQHAVSLCHTEGIDVSLVHALPCKVMLREQRMAQFEQIELLLQEVELRDKDFVMVLDDDDLLIARPVPTDVLKSTQALYRGNEDQSTWNHIDVKRMLEEEYCDEDWEFVRDLSGYGCRANALRKVPFHQDDSFKHLADLDFMDYIDSLEEGLSYQRPYIFHRMHQSNGINSDWCEGFTEALSDLLEKMGGIVDMPLDQTTGEEDVCAPYIDYGPPSDSSCRKTYENEREVDRLSRLLYKQ